MANSPQSSVLSPVQLVNEPQPGQRQVRIDRLDRRGLAGDTLGETTGGDHAGGAAEFGLDALHEPVDQPDVAEDDARLEGGNGVAPDRVRRRIEPDVEEPRATPEDRLR